MLNYTSYPRIFPGVNQRVLNEGITHIVMLKQYFIPETLLNVNHISPNKDITMHSDVELYFLYLKVFPDVGNRAVNEDIANFFLQWLPLAVQLVNCIQVVQTTNCLPFITLKMTVSQVSLHRKKKLLYMWNCINGHTNNINNQSNGLTLSLEDVRRSSLVNWRSGRGVLTQTFII